MLQPRVGQTVWDTRDGRKGTLVAIPSPYSPFVSVNYQTGVTATVSLEYLTPYPIERG